MAKIPFPYTQKELVAKVNEILAEYEVPLTLRQIYYRLVSDKLENKKSRYKSLSDKLARAREQGLVPWSKIIDLKRQPEIRNQWKDVYDFYDWVKNAYSRNLQQRQPKHIEIWCEKAVAIQDLANKYGIAVLAGGGYRSSTSLYETSKRMGVKPTVLYLGDWDPSGLDIERSLKEEMFKVFKIDIDIQRVLLNHEDIAKYNLQPALAKWSDARTKKFVETWGENVYELDALPPDVIIQKTEDAIKRNLDLPEYENQLREERSDWARIEEELEGLLGAE